MCDFSLHCFRARALMGATSSRSAAACSRIAVLGRPQPPRRASVMSAAAAVTADRSFLSKAAVSLGCKRFCASSASTAEAPTSQSSPRPPPSARTKQLAAELLALDAQELKQLRELCRDRLIAKPSGKTGPVKKDYDPSVKIKRSDRPLPVRGALRDVGLRFPAIHPFYVFAGGGAGIMPVPMPPLSQAFMAPHVQEMMGSMPSPAAPTIAAPTPESAAPAPAEEETPAEGEAAPAEKEADKPLKASVSLRLVGFEAAKKIAVIKEVRAMLNEGLKESKELVERAPVVLKKNVQRADAEALAEKLKSAGAEIALE